MKSRADFRPMGCSGYDPSEPCAYAVTANPIAMKCITKVLTSQNISTLRPARQRTASAIQCRVVALTLSILLSAGSRSNV